jgi:drug/metabolite transporter (DMT)-like permease
VPPSPISSAQRFDRPLYALALRAGAMITLAAMFAAVKYAGEHGVHVVESLFFRQFFALPIALLSLIRGPGIRSIYTEHFGKHVSRSMVGLCGMLCYFLSVGMLSLPEAMTIGFTVPIFATILSALFLRETVGLHRWGAVLVGFSGVLVIMQPGNTGTLDMLGAAIALMAAFIASVVTILLRQLGKTEEPATIIFWFSVLSLLPLGILMPFFARSHPPEIWLLLTGMGLVGGLAQLLLTAALRWGPVSLVISVDYSSLLWSTLLAWMIWDSLPSPFTWLGALLICGSGLYISWREHVRLREVRSAQPPLVS